MRFLIGIISINLLFFTLAKADIYRYIDERGIVHYTNIPKNNRYQKIFSTHDNNKTTYIALVQRIARRYTIDPLLIGAIIEAESGWNRFAISPKGALGLMQLMPSTIRDMKVKNPFDPEENIEAGIRYFKMLLKRFKGNLKLALAAYNAGPSVIEENNRIPSIPETRDFVNTVLSIYNRNKRKSNPPIVKIKLSDGTILLTNTPDLYR